MSARRRRIGRLKVEFSVLEKVAAQRLADDALAEAAGCKNWTLTKHSALYRRKDGTYTLCLIWHGDTGQTLTHTMRGFRLEIA